VIFQPKTFDWFHHQLIFSLVFMMTNFVLVVLRQGLIM
jgi:hypothetical protein